jgi:hypothetical protein
MFSFINIIFFFLKVEVFINYNKERKSNYGKIIVHLKPKQKWYHLMSNLIDKTVTFGFITVVHEVHLNRVSVEGDTEVRKISSEEDVVKAFVSLGVFFINKVKKIKQVYKYYFMFKEGHLYVYLCC